MTRWLWPVALAVCLPASAGSNCDRWQALVDPSMQEPKGGRDQVLLDTSEAASAEAAIACLLALDTDERAARFCGNTRGDANWLAPGTCPIRVEALYYVSFIFTRQWGHAVGTALLGPDGVMNSEPAVRAAAAAYRKWFEEVRRIGIDEARRRHMTPLAGADVHWIDS